MGEDGKWQLEARPDPQPLPEMSSDDWRVYFGIRNKRRKEVLASSPEVHVGAPNGWDYTDVAGPTRTELVEGKANIPGLLKLVRLAKEIVNGKKS